MALLETCVGVLKGDDIIRKCGWLELEDISYDMTDPWLVLGDFNAILHASEKIGSQELCWKGMDEFNQCLINCNVSDMGFKGPDFTWKRGRLHERLDRACSSEAWNIAWPNRFVSHLPFYNSDHRPILLYDERISVPREHIRSFKFMAAWLTDSRFGDLVRSCWENGDWLTARRKFEVDATFWHHNVFKEVFKQKNRLYSRLNGLDSYKYGRYDHNTELLQKDLWRELQSILVKEELIWFQRSRNHWLKFGDKNTRFFHASTVARRRHNRIVTLKDEGGNWIADSESLVQLAVSFYQGLFTSEGVREDIFPIQKMFPRLAEHDMRRLAFIKRIVL
ncbi:uncharacterized protein LOC133303170 [Gastrolobium bilobum]|uniref:uncharacterized protein LOC133303170 n=1 Tax=Gastrolobium bilobum TaxID=150636 RepID=UPI002AB01019|nr:uncharacterized protein LOC133303170 [Gastrolobium bilobum]